MAWTTVGHKNVRESHSCTCCTCCNFSADQAWKVTNHMSRTHHICPFASCKQPHATAAELAKHLYDRHYKTTEAANLVAGVVRMITCQQCNNHAAFTNELLWNRHCVEKHGRCPMAYCRCSCGDANRLCAHLVKDHHKTPMQARKMCFLGDDKAATVGFAPVARPKKVNPIAKLLQQDAKKKKVVMNARAKTEAARPMCGASNPEAEARIAAKFRETAIAKKAVTDAIFKRHKRTMDPKKHSLANLQKALAKLDKEL